MTSPRSDPLDALLLFHRSIRAALDTLDALVEQAEGDVDAVKAAALCEFFTGPMRWHDADERESLLRRLVRADPAEFDGALRAAIEEHLAVEAVVDDVLAHLQDVAYRATPPNASQLRRAARALRETLGPHLAQEERDVFLRARAVLTPHDLEEMAREIAARRLARPSGEPRAASGAK